MNGLRIFIFFLFSISLITKSKAQTFSDQEFSMISFVESLSSYGDYNSFSASRKNNIDSAVNWLNSVEYDERFNTYKVWFYYHRGRLVFVQKKIDLAKIDLEKAINLDTTNYDVMERICALSSHFKTYPTRKNFIKRGVAGYKHKLSIDSSKAEDWYYYALFMDLQSNYSSTHNIIKQRYALEKAVQLDSTEADYWYELSMCYYRVVDKKIYCLEKALQYRETCLYREHIIATLMQTVQDNQRSINYLTECIQLYTSKYSQYTDCLKNFYFLRSEVYRVMGNTQQQKLDLKASKELN